MLIVISHMLQELTVSSYVPNDTLLMGGNNYTERERDDQVPSMILLTGPNYSGKSVYMKQVGTHVHYQNSYP